MCFCDNQNSSHNHIQAIPFILTHLLFFNVLECVLVNRSYDNLFHLSMERTMLAFRLTRYFK
jgi:hypothetical protein